MSIPCLNDGQLIWNLISNEYSCQCHPCYQGVNCSDLIPRKQQIEFDEDYHKLIISLILLCLTLLNNLFTLVVCLGSVRIRRTNIGVYLILYSIICIIGRILLVINRSIQYYKRYDLTKDTKFYETLDCFLQKSGEHATTFICLWLSALIAFERSSIIYSTIRLNANQWRSVKILLISLCFITPSTVLMLIYRCEWGVPHKTLKSRITSALLYTVGFLAGVVYILSTVLVLKSFALRISDFTLVQQSRTRIFLVLLRRHLFIFIPPITFLLCTLPYQIWYPVNRSKQSFLHCGISFLEYIFKIVVKELTSLPTAITWLIFIYPSNVYMAEFYEILPRKNV